MQSEGNTRTSQDKRTHAGDSNMHLDCLYSFLSSQEKIAILWLSVSPGSSYQQLEICSFFFLFDLKKILRLMLHF